MASGRSLRRRERRGGNRVGVLEQSQRTAAFGQLKAPETSLSDAGKSALLMDIARYLGLSSEAVSRATARLSRERIVAFPSLRVAQIINRSEFDRLTRVA